MFSALLTFPWKENNFWNEIFSSRSHRSGSWAWEWMGLVEISQQRCTGESLPSQSWLDNSIQMHPLGKDKQTNKMKTHRGKWICSNGNFRPFYSIIISWGSTWWQQCAQLHEEINVQIKKLAFMQQGEHSTVAKNMDCGVSVTSFYQ